MKLRHWNGLELVDIQPPDLKDHCRAGIYVCCSSAEQHTHNEHPSTCGYHLWIYCGVDPTPHHNILLNKIRTEVPHVNGHGSHA